MPSFRDLLAITKTQITEIDTAGADAELKAGGPVVVLDVREPEEYAQGALPNVIHTAEPFVFVATTTLVLMTVPVD